MYMLFFFYRGRNRGRKGRGRKYRKVKLRFRAGGQGQSNASNSGSHVNTVNMSPNISGTLSTISHLSSANQSTCSHNTAALPSANQSTGQLDVHLIPRVSTPVTIVTDVNTNFASDSEGVCCACASVGYIDDISFRR